MDYQPLDDARNEIRLIRIIPNDNEAYHPGLVHCTLGHVSPDDFTLESQEFMSRSGSRFITVEDYLKHIGWHTARPGRESSNEEWTDFWASVALTSGLGRWT